MDDSVISPLLLAPPPPPLPFAPLEPLQEPQAPHAPPPQAPPRRGFVRGLLGAVLTPLTLPLRLLTRRARNPGRDAHLPPEMPLRRSSSVRSMDRPRSPGARERDTLPGRRDVLGEKVTPAARLALEAAGLEDGGATPPTRPAPRQSRLASTSARESSALDGIAAALRTNGAPSLADNRALLARFAVTRNFEVQPTVEILMQYYAWRQSMHLDKLTRADVAGELDKRYVMWLPAVCDDGTAPPCSADGAGRDFDGKPVLYKCMAAWERAPRGDARAVDAVHAWVFESVCREMDAETSSEAADTFSVLLDLTSAASRFDVDAFRSLGAMLKLGFRGRLHRMVIYPAGRLERVVFAGVKKFMGRGTPQKVLMLAAHERAQLLALFPRDLLPVHLGGRSLVVAGAQRSILRRTRSDASMGSARISASSSNLLAATAHQPGSSLQAAGQVDEDEDEETDAALPRMWPLGWTPRESLKETLLRLAVQGAIGSVFFDYGFLRGSRAEARHLQRHHHAPSLLLAAPPPAQGPFGMGYLGVAWGALLASLRFVGSPWRLFPFLLHSLGGCAVGATLLGTPRVAGATLSGAYFMGRLVAHVEHTAGRSPSARGAHAPLERLVMRLPLPMRKRPREEPRVRPQISLADMPAAGLVDLVGAAA